MYIKANIDDCALIINEFLPDELFKKIKNYDYKLDKKNASYSHWDEYLFKDDKQNSNKVEPHVELSTGVIKSIKTTLVSGQFFRVWVAWRRDVIYYYETNA